MAFVSTVFVLGAGASVEFGLPTGAGLSQQVGKLLDFYQGREGGLSRGDELILSRLDRSNQSQYIEYFHAGR